MRALILSMLLATGAGAEDRCVITIVPACSPGCESRGAVCAAIPNCSEDSSLWFRAEYAGACGSRPPTWTVTPGAPDGWVNGWHRDHDAVDCGEGVDGGTLWCAARAILRGPGGITYTVTATAEGGTSASITVEIPMPQPGPKRSGLGPQCPGQGRSPVTVGEIRALLDDSGLADGAMLAVLLDGKVARLVTVAAAGCWAQGNARGYGLEHCDSGQALDILALY